MQSGTGGPEPSARMTIGSSDWGVLASMELPGVGGDPPPPDELLVPPEEHETWLLCMKAVQLVAQSPGSELVSVTQAVPGFKSGRHCTM